VGLFSEIIGGGLLWLRSLVALGILFGILALVAWGAVSLLRGSTTVRQGPEDPELILKVRLARGEISVEEYERLRGYIRT